jgi:hypothetical protein
MHNPCAKRCYLNLFILWRPIKKHKNNNYNHNGNTKKHTHTHQNVSE